MGAEELRDAVSGIRMTEDMRMAVIKNVKERTGESGRQDIVSEKKDQERSAGSGKRRQAEHTVKVQKKRKTGRSRRQGAGWRKNLAAAAVVLVAVGVAAFPVRAFVNSLVRERMEEMPQEEKDTYVDTLKEQQVAADGSSRAYTEQERARYSELAQKYQEGTFPERAVPQVDSEEEAAGYEFCYLVPTSTFCLPDREMTDEELLEIIDFMAKREYAFTEEYAREHAEEIAEQEAQEQAAIAENVEGGGITEQQAIETAAQKLSDLFDMTGEGFVQNSYFDEAVDRGGRPVYCVNWTNDISHKYYYFDIDAEDGHMVRASYSGEEVFNVPFLTKAEAQEEIPKLQAAAEATMKNQVGEPYDRVYVYYLHYEDGSTGSWVSFLYAKEDENAAYGITYTWNGILFEIAEEDISKLQDGMERELWNGEAYDKAKVVFHEFSE